jgi:hypothetical protein
MKSSNDLESYKQLLYNKLDESEYLIKQLRSSDVMIYQEDSQFVKNYLICPLCMQVPVDGWVSNLCKQIMCYICIMKYLRENRSSG